MWNPKESVGMIMVFDFFNKKEEKEKNKQKTGESKDKEKQTQEKKEKKQQNEILALSVDSKEGLKEALDEFKRGKPTLVGIKEVKKKGRSKTKTLVEELLSFTKKRKGRILGVGDDYLLLTPDSYKLNVKQNTNIKEPRKDVREAKK